MNDFPSYRPRIRPRLARIGRGLCCVIPHFYIWVCHTCNVCRLTPIHMPLTQIVDSRFESRVIYAYIEYSTRNLWFPDSNFVSGAFVYLTCLTLDGLRHLNRVVYCIARAKDLVLNIPQFSSHCQMKYRVGLNYPFQVWWI